LPSLKIDAQILLSVLNVDLVSRIADLGPFGVGNPYPVLCSRNVRIKSRPTIVGRDTIKFWVTDSRLTCQVIGFGMADIFESVASADSLDIAFSPSLDTFSQPTTVQLELKDIKIN
jgi:single-stranded-DNA-specific exonuclease